MVKLNSFFHVLLTPVLCLAWAAQGVAQSGGWQAVSKVSFESAATCLTRVNLLNVPSSKTGGSTAPVQFRSFNMTLGTGSTADGFELAAPITSQEFTLLSQFMGGPSRAFLPTFNQYKLVLSVDGKGTSTFLVRALNADPKFPTRPFTYPLQPITGWDLLTEQACAPQSSTATADIAAAAALTTSSQGRPEGRVNFSFGPGAFSFDRVVVLHPNSGFVGIGRDTNNNPGGSPGSVIVSRQDGSSSYTGYASFPMPDATNKSRVSIILYGVPGPGSSQPVVVGTRYVDLEPYSPTPPPSEGPLVLPISASAAVVGNNQYGDVEIRGVFSFAAWQSLSKVVVMYPLSGNVRSSSLPPSSGFPGGGFNGGPAPGILILNNNGSYEGLVSIYARPASPNSSLGKMYVEVYGREPGQTSGPDKLLGRKIVDVN